MENITHLLVSAGIIGGAIAVGLLLNLLLSSLLHLRHSRKPFTFRGLPLNLAFWRGPVAVILPGLAVGLAIPFLDLPVRVTTRLSQALTIWLIGGFSWLIVRTIAMAREMVDSRLDVQASDNLSARRVATQIKVFERILVTIVIVVTIALMLMTFQTVRQIGVSILASAGVIGLAIGFAAQKSLATILAGLQIAITQPIRIEDAVMIDGNFGRIEEITLTFVVVRLFDQKRMIVPITEFIEKPFQNWTRTSSELVGTVFIYTDYSLPVQAVRAELERIVSSTDLWDGRVCKLQVTNISNEGMELRALASAVDSSHAWDLRCLIRERIVEYIKDHFPESLPRTRVNLDRQSEAQSGNGNFHVSPAIASGD